MTGKNYTQAIGSIGNSHGGLSVKLEDGKYYWGIENWNGTKWDEIPGSLYKELIAYQEELQKSSSEVVI